MMNYTTLLNVQMDSLYRVDKLSAKRMKAQRGKERREIQGPKDRLHLYIIEGFSTKEEAMRRE